MIRVSALCFVLLFAAGCGTQGPVKCTAANCSGCCTEAGECLGTTRQTPQACGVPGAACRVCLPQQLCVAGACTQDPDASVILDDAGTGGGTGGGGGGTGGGGGSVACGARGQACCTGQLCNLTYTCQRGVCDVPGAVTDAGTCGALGQACCANQTCTASGTTCSGGSCVAATADAGTLKALGEGCALDRECADGACLVLGFAGGYCTKGCTTATDCTAGSQCGSNPSGVGPVKVCLKQCSQPQQSPGGCRTGYVCEPNAGTASIPVCYPGCTSNTTCGLAPTCDSRGFCCGVAGYACCDGTTCDSGNTCTSGTCQASVACGADGQACCTSGTACTSGTCVSGTCQSAASCGNAGQPCCTSGTACLGTTTCQSGTCQQPAACGGIAQACCASGTACAAGGVCQSGYCRALTGGTCSSSVYCEGNACITSWPSGYCSNTCTTSADCGTQASCSPYVTTGTSYCLQHCTWDGAQGSCRTGYVCDRYMTGAADPATCVAACTSAASCSFTGRCSNGFCCGKKFYRCCASGAACEAGSTCTNGYCQ